MRKSCIYLGSLLAALAAAALLMFFIGKSPDERDVLSAIPKQDADSAYFLLSGEGQAFRLDPHNTVLEQIRVNNTPYIEKLMQIQPLLSKAKSMALLVQKTDDGVEVYGSARYSFDELQSISEGKIPEKWTGLGRYSMEKTGEKDILVYSGGKENPMQIEIDGELVLMSFREKQLKLMQSVLRGEHERAEMKRKKDYDAHVEVNDGGFVSQFASIYGIEAKPGNVLFRSDWVEEDDGTAGKLEWKISGLGAIMPDKITDMIQPRKWDERIPLPAPILFAAGANLPRIDLNEIRDLDLVKLQEETGLALPVLQKVLSGPIVAEIAGKSKFLLFSLPGVTINLLGSDRGGRELVDRLWSGKWSSFRSSVKALEGYDYGGISSLPLSLVAASGNDLTVIGMMEKKFVEQVDRAGSTIPLLDKMDDSVLWLFMDGPGISRALDGVLSVSSLVKSIGDPLGEKADLVKDASERLKMMGQITLVVESLEKGRIEWQNDELTGPLN